MSRDGLCAEISPLSVAIRRPRLADMKCTLRARRPVGYNERGAAAAALFKSCGQRRAVGVLLAALDLLELGEKGSGASGSPLLP